MTENDTVRLLRECDAGIKMGISAIEDVLPNVSADSMKQLLEDGRQKHEMLQQELGGMLQDCHDEGKDPSPMAKGMSKMKTNMKMAVHDSDQTIADLMTDGCNMGVKSLHKYLNQYRAADKKSKDIVKRLINLEEHLAIDLRSYL